jgi:hypothetical protein
MTHWYIARPFITPPWHRPLPTVRQWLALLFWGFLFFMALRPYAQFGAQRGWIATGAKLVEDVIHDCQAAYRDGRQHNIRRFFEQ